MTRHATRYDRAVSTLSRRQALAGGATLLTAGGTLVWVGQPASAAVSVEEWTVADATFEAEAVTPVVDATVQWSYDVGERAVAELFVGLSVDGETIASETLDTKRTVLDGDSALSGDVTDSSAWDQSDFEVGVGEAVTRTLTIGVTFEVRDESGVIVADSDEDSAEVEVSHPQETKLLAEVGGSATITDGSA